jgi:hypothetical protein
VSGAFVEGMSNRSTPPGVSPLYYNDVGVSLEKP